MLWNGIYFLTGYSPNGYLTTVLIALGVCLAQLLFFRIMRPKVMKALPMLLSAAYVGWMLWCGYSPIDAAVAAVCSALMWLICTLKKPLR